MPQRVSGTQTISESTALPTTGSHVPRYSTAKIEVIGLPAIRDVTVAELGSKYLIGLGIIERYMS